jgi:hypothetical protein
MSTYGMMIVPTSAAGMRTLQHNHLQISAAIDAMKAAGPYAKLNQISPGSNVTNATNIVQSTKAMVAASVNAAIAKVQTDIGGMLMQLKKRRDGWN